jgi:anti-sigma factor RsiW
MNAFGMNCRCVQSKLSAYCDGELRGVESLQVRDHLSRCEVCLAELEALREVTSHLQQLSQVPAPPMGAEERAVARIRSTSGVAVRRFPQIALASLAFGAVLGVIALSLFNSSLSRGSNSTATRERDAVEREIQRDQIAVGHLDSLDGSSFAHTASFTER